MKAVSVDDSSLTLSKQTCCLQSGAGHVALGLPDCAHYQGPNYALKHLQFVHTIFMNSSLLKKTHLSVIKSRLTVL